MHAPQAHARGAMPHPAGERTHRRLLAGRRLYLVLDVPTLGRRDPATALRAAIAGGVDLVQLRDKHSSDSAFRRLARSLGPICHAAGIPFVLNDRVHLVRDADADGVHLGQEDMPLDAARRDLGTGFLIGISTHDLEQARSAAAAGADYLGFGPIFATPTKPERAAIGTAALARALAAVRIPIYPIGGIGPDTIEQVLAAGADRCAVVRAILAAADLEAAAARLAIAVRPRPEGFEPGSS